MHANLKRLQQAVLHQVRLRLRIRGERDRLEKQSEVSLGDVRDALLGHKVREVEEVYALLAASRVTQRAGLTAQTLHLDVNLRPARPERVGPVVRREEPAALARSHALEPRRGARPADAGAPAGPSPAPAPAAAPAAARRFTRARLLALLLPSGPRDLPVPVVIVVVVAVHVLGLPSRDVVARSATSSNPLPHLSSPALLLLLLDGRLVSLEHHRVGIQVGIERVDVVVAVVVFAAFVVLGSADPTAAPAGAAEALDRVVPVTLKVVVERQLVSGVDVGERVYADAKLAVHHPLLRLAVGIARVVEEATRVASLRRVDSLRRRQGHKVVVSPALIVVPRLSRPVLVLVQHLADVLDDELPFLKRLLGEQAVALAAGALDVELRVVLLLKLLVLAPVAARAKRWIALDEHVPVDAVGAASLTRLRVRNARAYEHVVLRHALRLAVREDVAVDPVPDVLRRLCVLAPELIHLGGLLPGLLRGEKDVDLVVVDLLGSLAVGELRVVVQGAEPARERREARSRAKRS